MIGYVLLLACVLPAVAVVVYAVAPAARGVHRYAVPRAKLREALAVSEAVREELACKLLGLASELEGTYAESAATGSARDDALADLEKAGRRIADLEEQLRDADELRATNTALRASLANALSVSTLPPHSSTPPSVRPGSAPVPLNQAPFAVSPTTPG